MYRLLTRWYILTITIILLTGQNYPRNKKINYKNHENDKNGYNNTSKKQRNLYEVKNSGHSWEAILKDTSRSIVCVIKYAANFNWFEPYKTPSQNASTGTGFFINNNGYIITNAHCIEQAAVIYVQLPEMGKEYFDTEIIAVSFERDIALLRLTKESYKKILDFYKNENKIFTYLTFGDSDTVSRGQEIATLGFPLGQEFLKATRGSVSGIQTLQGRNFIQIDAPINSGNSGGPALNRNGEVIGINTAAITANGAQNVGYIIPAKEALIFLKQIYDMHIIKDSYQESTKENETMILVREPVIGIKYHGSPIPVIEYFNNPLPGGPYITEVVSLGWGAKIGLKPGDMIYSVNGHTIDRFGDLSVPWSEDKISLGQFLYQLNINDEVIFNIYRDGKHITLKSSWSPVEPFPIRAMFPDFEKIDYIIIGGMVIMPLTLNHISLLSKTPFFEDLEKYTQLKNTTEGRLLVTHVFPNSLAQKARFVHPGMVIKAINDIPVATLNDCYNAIIKNSKKSGNLAIKFDGGEFFVGKIKDIIAEEPKLSLLYNYQISKIVKELMK